jgi:GNAT superfamily N-acetyltransferase
MTVTTTATRMMTMTAEPDLTTLRAATAAEADALTALERDTNLEALAHVFPGVPYPTDEVCARWTRLIADPSVRVAVAGPAERLDVYLAWDDDRLRHLGVRPDLWGRGLARAAVEHAVGVRRLWVLRDNTRARGFYEHLGWAPTGREQTAEWPPYPVELEYAR